MNTYESTARVSYEETQKTHLKQFGAYETQIERGGQPSENNGDRKVCRRIIPARSNSKKEKSHAYESIGFQAK